MTTFYSPLKAVKLTIQKDLEGQYIKILINGVTVLEGPEVTADDLFLLFKDMGFSCKLEVGVFGGIEDDQYDDVGNPKFVGV
jgi:hypothetical protein